MRSVRSFRQHVTVAGVTLRWQNIVCNLGNKQEINRVAMAINIVNIAQDNQELIYTILRTFPFY